MFEVRSVKELRRLIEKLSTELECDEEVSIVLRSVPNELLTLAPKYLISKELSLTDIEEVGNGYIIHVIKRFGRGCSKNASSGFT